MLRLGFRRDAVDWFQIPFSVFYAGLTGFSISVNRSLVQKILANFGIKALDNFSLTLLLLFITAPKFLLTTGGTLSLLFAFVISIFGDRFENLPKYRKLLAKFNPFSIRFAVSHPLFSHLPTGVDHLDLCLQLSF